MHIYTFIEKFSCVPVLLTPTIFITRLCNSGYLHWCSGFCNHDIKWISKSKRTLWSLSLCCKLPLHHFEDLISRQHSVSLYFQRLPKNSTLLWVLGKTQWRKDSVMYFTATCQIEVKEFKPLIKRSFSSTTSCRQSKLVLALRQSSAQPADPGEGRAGWLHQIAGSTWYQRSILHQQKLQDLVKEKTCAPYSCKRKVEMCGLPFESVWHLPVPLTAPGTLECSAVLKVLSLHKCQQS